MSDSIVIVGASRTPMGAFQGELASLDASDLGGSAIAGAMKNAGIEVENADEVIMGCCLPAGQGQAPARQAAFKAGLPEDVPATTLNKMCGSGMKTTMVAYDQLSAGNGDVVIAGGMESMTNAPYLLPKMRGGARLGHGEVIDHMFLDGLEDAYDKGRLMGTFAEECAEKYQFTRQAQDDFALRSLENANRARENGTLTNEITPVVIKSRKGETEIVSDESPRKAMPEKIPNLRPAFKKDGTVTAANASSISDGAAALVLMRESDARQQGLKIRARILGHASHAQAPNWFTTAPVPAINKLLKSIDWTKDDVDLWEINEAFAVVPMAAQVEIGIDRDKVNVHGGACAVGHPIGASGARIIVTLLNALESRGLKKGMAGICIGGGEGTAIAIELA
ncbi:MAG: acetyl-CoA C-acyltransferase [Hyphomicrobiales bacterium]|nr:acetyl-CoA C-acyltransferase [Hyphomicrobiales bacterium]